MAKHRDATTVHAVSSPLSLVASSPGIGGDRVPSTAIRGAEERGCRRSSFALGNRHSANRPRQNPHRSMSRNTIRECARAARNAARERTPTACNTAGARSRTARNTAGECACSLQRLRAREPSPQHPPVIRTCTACNACERTRRARNTAGECTGTTCNTAIGCTRPRPQRRRLRPPRLRLPHRMHPNLPHPQKPQRLLLHHHQSPHPSARSSGLSSAAAPSVNGRVLGSRRGRPIGSQLSTGRVTGTGLGSGLARSHPRGGQSDPIMTWSPSRRSAVGAA
jgi:hypothetical protein